ncbi:hypothetical protein B0H14DRAFT_2599190 [Mycena olivaceomarginata]|nr:hypothetical protein B0H14DRAFT_2599190 [Mycena olivaceomarginata]
MPPAVPPPTAKGLQFKPLIGHPFFIYGKVHKITHYVRRHSRTVNWLSCGVSIYGVATDNALSPSTGAKQLTGYPDHMSCAETVDAAGTWPRSHFIFFAFGLAARGGGCELHGEPVGLGRALAMGARMGLLRAGHYFRRSRGSSCGGGGSGRGGGGHTSSTSLSGSGWQAIADLIQRVVVVGRVLLIMGRVFFFVVLLAVVLSGYSTYNKRRDVEIKRLKWRGERGKAERGELAAAACLGAFSELGGRNIVEDKQRQMPFPPGLSTVGHASDQVLILARVDSPGKSHSPKTKELTAFDASCGEILRSEGDGGSREESERALNGGNAEESRWERGSREGSRRRKRRREVVEEFRNQLVKRFLAVEEGRLREEGEDLEGLALQVRLLRMERARFNRRPHGAAAASHWAVKGLEGPLVMIPLTPSPEYCKRLQTQD